MENGKEMKQETKKEEREWLYEPRNVILKTTKNMNNI